MCTGVGAGNFDYEFSQVRKASRTRICRDEKIWSIKPLDCFSFLRKVGSKIIICEWTLGRRFGVLKREDVWNSYMKELKSNWAKKALQIINFSVKSQIFSLECSSYSFPIGLFINFIIIYNFLKHQQNCGKYLTYFKSLCFNLQNPYFSPWGVFGEKGNCNNPLILFSAKSVMHSIQTFFKFSKSCSC